MFNHLTLRKKLTAIVLPPLGVLAILAVYAVLLGFRGAASVDELTSDIKTLGVVALAAAILSTLAVLVVGRTIADPLAELTEAADELANVRLPQLVESLKNPNAPHPEFAPISIEHEDGEMGQLIRALNAVQDSAAEVAGEQRAIVQAGVSDLVVNLARRNQTLIDRQIETIDSLEANEENPDRLEQLFALDHLATRMRRNAESLLIVAGAEPPRRRGAPVDVADVLRVAMSEIEDYRRVSLRSVDDALIGNQSAVDLAHLLSELMENAASFSPPDTQVEVKGMQEPDGYYLISVTDAGIGMSDEQLSAANTILANPPELGLGLSRSLGFIVVGRLARRLGVRVELARGTSTGVTALVLVPSSVLAGASAVPVSSPTDQSADQPLETHDLADLDAPTTAPPTSEVPAGFDAPPPFGVPASFGEPAFDAPPPFEVPASFGEPAFDAPPPFEVPAGFDAAPPFEVPASLAAPAVPEPTFDAGEPFDLPDHWIDQPSVEPATPIEFQSEALAELLGEKAPVQEPAPVFEAPGFETPVVDQSSAPVDDPFMPTSLAQAIPDGEQFDAGVASLLQPGHPSSYRAQPPAAGSGLARRDRSQSQAPPSEGRPVAPSVRSPEEIRQMLARYRDGRNRPTGGAADHTDSFSQDPFNAGGQA